MTLFSRRERREDSELLELAARFCFTYVHNLEAYEDIYGKREAGQPLSTYREAALYRARFGAYFSRVFFERSLTPQGFEELPEGWLPLRAFGAHARLVYALTAIAEEDPEPEALMTLEETTALTAQYGLAEWVAYWRGRFPSVGSVFGSEEPA